MGNLYVTETDTPSVRRIDAAADVTTIAKGPHAGDLRTTGLIAPEGIAITASGTLYITDGFYESDLATWKVDWLHRIIGTRLETLSQCKKI